MRSEYNNLENPGIVVIEAHVLRKVSDDSNIQT